MLNSQIVFSRSLKYRGDYFLIKILKIRLNGNIWFNDIATSNIKACDKNSTHVEN